MTTAPTQYLPILVRDGEVTDWERKFCASLIAQERRGGRLTEKQAEILTRIVQAFQRRALTDDKVTE